MKKAIIKKLKTVAEGLPLVMEPKPQQLSGAEILEQFKGKKRDLKGKKISPKEVYTSMQMQPVDHLTKLKAVYKNGGDKAVTEYSELATRKHAQQQKATPKKIQTV